MSTHSSPPDPASPAWLALADQLDSAAQHAHRIASHLIEGGGGRFLGVAAAEGPWVRARLASVSPDHRRAICEHLLEGPPIRPLFVLAPHVLGCWDCLQVALSVRETLPELCEACGSPDGGALGVLIAQQGLYVAVGELCRSCVRTEAATI
jgi:hypothetical protein